MTTTKIDSSRVQMIAHRGLSGIERENTCAAFIAAANRSYFGIETDVHITKDGEFVLIHDSTTKRVSLGEYDINVEENDYKEVAKVILPDLDNSTYRKDLKIPLLSEYISICKKYNKICVLELKNYFKEQDLKKLLKEIEHMDYLEKVIFISFDFDNCINVRKLLEKNTVQWLVKNEKVTTEREQVLSQNRIDLDINYKRLNKEYVELLHSKGIKVNCWTCDDMADAEKLISYGVDFITTNILE